jgi:anti-sigma regulatory factor (Ser/Thr protein kinase)
VTCAAPTDKAPVNGTTGEFPPAAVPISGAALDDAALSGRGRLLHGAAVFGSDAELLAVAVPYLEDGLSAGDLTVLSCSAETTELIRRELGPAALGLESDPGLVLQDTRPPDVFTHLRQYAHRATQGGTSRLRVFSEVPATDDPLQAREEIRVEAAANHVMSELPVTGLCVYDSRRLPASLVDSASDTHPLLVSGAAWTPNSAFSDPAVYIRGLPSPRASEENLQPVVAIDDAPTLPDLRHLLIGALPGLVHDDEQLEDLRLGVSEVAANAFRHGKRPVSARLWCDGAELVCEITDSGTTFDNPLAGFVPAHGFDLGRGGMGLWLARKLFDHVDLCPGPGGFTVRLAARLRRPVGALDA